MTECPWCHGSLERHDLATRMEHEELARLEKIGKENGWNPTCHDCGHSIGPDGKRLEPEKKNVPSGIKR